MTVTTRRPDIHPGEGSDKLGRSDSDVKRIAYLFGREKDGEADGNEDGDGPVAVAPGRGRRGAGIVM